MDNILTASKMKDAWLRTAADFDNYRKRIEARDRQIKRSAQLIIDDLRAAAPAHGNLVDSLQAVIDKL